MCRIRGPRLLPKVLSLVAALSLLGCSDQFSIPLEAGAGGVLLASWTDGDELLAVGGHLDGTSGLLVRAQEDTWCADDEFADRPIWWIHGNGQGRWYAVGENGLILRHEAGETTDESVDTPATLYGVWDSGDRVLAVGGDVWGDRLGEIWLRDSGGWSLVASGLPGVLFKVWEDWIVGDSVIYRLGSGDLGFEQKLFGLQDYSVSEQPRLLTVRGRADDDVWAVGGNAQGTLWHWDGTAWSEVPLSPLCTNQALNGIWTDPGEDVWIAGMSGAMGAWTGSEWNCPEVPITGEHFHAVWPLGDEMLWFGGNLFSSGDNYATIARYGSEQRAIEFVDCP
ncbi:MAG TPA: hypothetical protein DIU15_15715 [Deltaproteobacteria bacterium]|nr:hypothetical protein [Deltaproteobacteria bacterium]HCP47488.1 hypothetical protein [Deltaproteobacteria bacterium]